MPIDAWLVQTTTRPPVSVDFDSVRPHLLTMSIGPQFVQTITTNAYVCSTCSDHYHQLMSIDSWFVQSTTTNNVYRSVTRLGHRHRYLLILALFRPHYYRWRRWLRKFAFDVCLYFSCCIVAIENTFYYIDLHSHCEAYCIHCLLLFLMRVYVFIW